VIRDVVDWPNARTYFAWRVRRRLAQDALATRLKAADPDLSHSDAVSTLSTMMGGDWEDDQAVLKWFGSASSDIDAKVTSVRDAAVQRTVVEMVGGMSAEAKAALLKAL
jgi:acetyl-CoA carboxylase/biotin carboxylase 1